MKSKLYIILVFILLVCADTNGQGLHFSQYYNSPLLTNAANTGLTPDNDFRLGLNYRKQWSVVPVPYNTFSGWGDFKIGGNRDNVNHNNWLGVGFAIFSDKAGDGNLAATQLQGDVAYHLLLSEHTMISLGLSGAYVQRSVNYDGLTFDTQWDGFTFNSQSYNGEKIGSLKTSYYTVGAGFNFAMFPSENVYASLGGGIVNINRPTESFYKQDNELDIRPTGTLDVIVRTGPVLIMHPSVYYSTQSGATEIVAGSEFRTVLSNGGMNTLGAQLILGAYDRIGDAIIAVAGVQIGPWQFTANYDFTTSLLAPYNAAFGGLEFSLIYQRTYTRQGLKRMFNCPRFF